MPAPTCFGEGGKRCGKGRIPIERWAHHKEEVLNRPISSTALDKAPAEEHLEVSYECPTRRRNLIRRTVGLLKSYTVAGLVGNSTKADLFSKPFTCSVSEIWKQDKILKDWKEAHLIKIPKNRDLGD